MSPGDTLFTSNIFNPFDAWTSLPEYSPRAAVARGQAIFNSSPLPSQAWPPSQTDDCKTTTDLGQALIDGKFVHVGKIKGPILRGLSARAPYFHNGSAQTLLHAVHFYEKRLGLVLTAQEESDLVAFLSAL